MRYLMSESSVSSSESVHSQIINNKIYQSKKTIKWETELFQQQLLSTIAANNMTIAMAMCIQLSAILCRNIQDELSENEIETYQIQAIEIIEEKKIVKNYTCIEETENKFKNKIETSEINIPVSIQVSLCSASKVIKKINIPLSMLGIYEKIGVKVNIDDNVAKAYKAYGITSLPSIYGVKLDTPLTILSMPILRSFQKNVQGVLKTEGQLKLKPRNNSAKDFLQRITSIEVKSAIDVFDRFKEITAERNRIQNSWFKKFRFGDLDTVYSNILDNFTKDSPNSDLIKLYLTLENCKINASNADKSKLNNSQADIENFFKTGKLSRWTIVKYINTLIESNDKSKEINNSNIKKSLQMGLKDSHSVFRGSLGYAMSSKPSDPSIFLTVFEGITINNFSELQLLFGDYEEQSLYKFLTTVIYFLEKMPLDARYRHLYIPIYKALFNNIKDAPVSSKGLIQKLQDALSSEEKKDDVFSEFNKLNLYETSSVDQLEKLNNLANIFKKNKEFQSAKIKVAKYFVNEIFARYKNMTAQQQEQEEYKTAIPEIKDNILKYISKTTFENLLKSELLPVLYEMIKDNPQEVESFLTGFKFALEIYFKEVEDPISAYIMLLDEKFAGMLNYQKEVQVNGKHPDFNLKVRNETIIGKDVIDSLLVSRALFSAQFESGDKPILYSNLLEYILTKTSDNKQYKNPEMAEFAKKHAISVVVEEFGHLLQSKDLSIKQKAVDEVVRLVNLSDSKNSGDENKVFGLPLDFISYTQLLHREEKRKVNTSIEEIQPINNHTINVLLKDLNSKINNSIENIKADDITTHITIMQSVYSRLIELYKDDSLKNDIDNALLSLKIKLTDYFKTFIAAIINEIKVDISKTQILERFYEKKSLHSVYSSFLKLCAKLNLPLHSSEIIVPESIQGQNERNVYMFKVQFSLALEEAIDRLTDYKHKKAIRERLPKEVNKYINLNKDELKKYRLKEEFKDMKSFGLLLHLVNLTKQIPTNIENYTCIIMQLADISSQSTALIDHALKLTAVNASSFLNFLEGNNNEPQKTKLALKQQIEALLKNFIVTSIKDKQLDDLAELYNPESSFAKLYAKTQSIDINAFQIQVSSILKDTLIEFAKDPNTTSEEFTLVFNHQLFDSAKKYLNIEGKTHWNETEIVNKFLDSRINLFKNTLKNINEHIANLKKDAKHEFPLLIEKLDYFFIKECNALLNEPTREQFIKLLQENASSDRIGLNSFELDIFTKLAKALSPITREPNKIFDDCKTIYANLNIVKHGIEQLTQGKSIKDVEIFKAALVEVIRLAQDHPHFKESINKVLQQQFKNLSNKWINDINNGIFKHEESLSLIEPLFNLYKNEISKEEFELLFNSKKSNEYVKNKNLLDRVIIILNQRSNSQKFDFQEFEQNAIADNNPIKFYQQLFSEEFLKQLSISNKENLVFSKNLGAIIPIIDHGLMKVLLTHMRETLTDKNQIINFQKIIVHTVTNSTSLSVHDIKIGLALGNEKTKNIILTKWMQQLPTIKEPELIKQHVAMIIDMPELQGNLRKLVLQKNTMQKESKNTIEILVRQLIEKEQLEAALILARLFRLKECKTTIIYPINRIDENLSSGTPLVGRKQVKHIYQSLTKIIQQKIYFNQNISIIEEYLKTNISDQTTNSDESILKALKSLRDIGDLNQFLNQKEVEDLRSQLLNINSTADEIYKKVSLLRELNPDKSPRLFENLQTSKPSSREKINQEKFNLYKTLIPRYYNEEKLKILHSSINKKFDTFNNLDKINHVQLSTLIEIDKELSRLINQPSWLAIQIDNAEKIIVGRLHVDSEWLRKTDDIDQHISQLNQLKYAYYFLNNFGTEQQKTVLSDRCRALKSFYIEVNALNDANPTETAVAYNEELIEEFLKYSGYGKELPSKEMQFSERINAFRVLVAKDSSKISEEKILKLLNEISQMKDNDHGKKLKELQYMLNCLTTAGLLSSTFILSLKKNIEKYIHSYKYGNSANLDFFHALNRTQLLKDFGFSEEIIKTLNIQIKAIIAGATLTHQFYNTLYALIKSKEIPSQDDFEKVIFDQKQGLIFTDKDLQLISGQIRALKVYKDDSFKIILQVFFSSFKQLETFIGNSRALLLGNIQEDLFIIEPSESLRKAIQDFKKSIEVYQITMQFINFLDNSIKINNYQDLQKKSETFLKNIADVEVNINIIKYISNLILNALQKSPNNINEKFYNFIKIIEHRLSSNDENKTYIYPIATELNNHFEILEQELKLFDNVVALHFYDAINIYILEVKKVIHDKSEITVKQKLLSEAFIALKNKISISELPDSFKNSIIRSINSNFKLLLQKIASSEDSQNASYHNQNYNFCRDYLTNQAIETIRNITSINLETLKLQYTEQYNARKQEFQYAMVSVSRFGTAEQKRQLWHLILNYLSVAPKITNGLFGLKKASGSQYANYEVEFLRDITTWVLKKNTPEFLNGELNTLSARIKILLEIINTYKNDMLANNLNLIDDNLLDKCLDNLLVYDAKSIVELFDTLYSAYIADQNIPPLIIKNQYLLSKLIDKLTKFIYDNMDNQHHTISPLVISIIEIFSKVLSKQSKISDLDENICSLLRMCSMNYVNCIYERNDATVLLDEFYAKEFRRLLDPELLQQPIIQLTWAMQKDFESHVRKVTIYILYKAGWKKAGDYKELFSTDCQLNEEVEGRKFIAETIKEFHPKTPISNSYGQFMLHILKEIDPNLPSKSAEFSLVNNMTKMTVSKGRHAMYSISAVPTENAKNNISDNKSTQLVI